MRFLLPVLIVLLAMGSVALPAHADDDVAAEAAFRRGRDLMKAGRYAEACDRFALSYRLDPEIGARLNLGICHQKLGRIATAWSELNGAADMAAAAGQRDRAEKIRDLAEGLEPRLCRLLLEANGVVPGLVVTRNGDDVTVMLDTAVPVDPGEYTIEATADGYVSWHATVTVRAEGKTVTVDIPVLDRVEKNVAPIGELEGDKAPRVDRAGKTPRADRDVKMPRADRGSARRLWGMSLVGGGALSVAVGLGFGYHALRKNNAYQDVCPDGVCAGPDSRGFELERVASRSANLANGFVGVGLVIAAAGAYLWITAPSPATDGDLVSITPVITPDVAGATVMGRF